MRKLLLSILSLFAFVFVANAAEITIDPDGEGVTWAAETDATYGAGFKSTINGLNVAIYKSTSTSNLVTPTDLIKVYKNAVLVIETQDGSNISNLVMTCSSSGYCKEMTDVDDSKVYAANTTNLTVTWTGSKNKVILKATNAQVRISSIAVTTIAADGIAAPTFSVAAGTYYQAKTVEITKANGSGKVYYTTNGDDPTAESTEYTAPIEITATTTLKAVVVDGDKSSDITSATYTIAAPVEVANIDEYLKKDDNAVVKFTNPVTAVYQSGAYLYVKDDTGVALVYGTVGQTYKNGDVIPAGFFGTKKYYNGIYELDTAVSDGSFKASTENNGAIDAAESKLADITADNVHQYVFFKGVTYDATDATNPKLKDDEGGELLVYKRFADLPVDGEYDVYGFIAVYKASADASAVVQIYPTEFVSKNEVENIADFKALGVGGIAKINCPLTVTAVYKTSKNVNYYVQDEDGDGIVIYGAIADLPEYEKTDIIPAGFTGTYAEYNGLPEIINCEGLAEATETGTIVATATTIEEIGTDAICRVVELSGAEILDINDSNFNIKDESATAAAYNKFGLERIEAYTGLKIVGIVDVRNNAIQILPIEIDYSNGTAEEPQINTDDDIVITTGEGQIIVEGGEEIQVVTPDGRATTVKGSGDTPDRRRRIIETENGIYIVVVDGEVVEKVYVE
ncbi:MAG: chitobiase/beta-hexosaminidase C-terminal domain-containing protein [Muribaculaceae bacterium]